MQIKQIRQSGYLPSCRFFVLASCRIRLIPSPTSVAWPLCGNDERNDSAARNSERPGLRGGIGYAAPAMPRRSSG